MHMLCPKCETSNWLGTSRPSGIVRCTNCGIVLIQSDDAGPPVDNPPRVAFHRGVPVQQVECVAKSEPRVLVRTQSRADEKTAFGRIATPAESDWETEGGAAAPAPALSASGIRTAISSWFHGREATLRA